MVDINFHLTLFGVNLKSRHLFELDNKQLLAFDSGQPTRAGLNSIFALNLTFARLRLEKQVWAVQRHRNSALGVGIILKGNVGFRLYRHYDPTALVHPGIKPNTPGHRGGAYVFNLRANMHFVRLQSIQTHALSHDHARNRAMLTLQQQGRRGLLDHLVPAQHQIRVRRPYGFFLETLGVYRLLLPPGALRAQPNTMAVIGNAIGLGVDLGCGVRLHRLADF